jgi:hypothetical protein
MMELVDMDSLGLFGIIYLIRSSRIYLILRVSVIVTCLTHDQKILVQILYPHVLIYIYMYISWTNG